MEQLHPAWHVAPVCRSHQRPAPAGRFAFLPIILGPFVLTRDLRLVRFPRFLQRPPGWSGFSEREVTVANATRCPRRARPRCARIVLDCGSSHQAFDPATRLAELGRSTSGSVSLVLCCCNSCRSQRFLILQRDLTVVSCTVHYQVALTNMLLPVALVAPPPDRDASPPTPLDDETSSPPPTNAQGQSGLR